MKTQSPGPVFRLRIVLGRDIAVGPGKADLLEGIRETGSIAAAGRRLGMSYKRAWLLVDTMNRCFSKPLVEAIKGGKTTKVDMAAMSTPADAARRRRARPLPANAECDGAGRLPRSGCSEAGYAQGA